MGRYPINSEEVNDGARKDVDAVGSLRRAAFLYWRPCAKRGGYARAGAGPSLELRDVTYPLSLVGPGRRIGAGPGFQPSASKGLVTVALVTKVVKTKEPG